MKRIVRGRLAPWLTKIANEIGGLLERHKARFFERAGKWVDADLNAARPLSLERLQDVPHTMEQRYAILLAIAWAQEWNTDNRKGVSRTPWPAVASCKCNMADPAVSDDEHDPTNEPPGDPEISRGMRFFGLMLWADAIPKRNEPIVREMLEAVKAELAAHQERWDRKAAQQKNAEEVFRSEYEIPDDLELGDSRDAWESRANAWRKANHLGPLIRKQHNPPPSDTESLANKLSLACLTGTLDSDRVKAVCGTERINEAAAWLMRYFVGKGWTVQQVMDTDGRDLLVLAESATTIPAAPQESAKVKNDFASDEAKPVNGKVKRKKRSTAKGDARAKIIPALIAWHKYDNGRCGNFDSISAVKLASNEYADVSEGSVSGFFKVAFGGYSGYVGACNQRQTLETKLQAMNGDFATIKTVGRAVQGEGGRDDD